MHGVPWSAAPAAVAALQKDEVQDLLRGPPKPRNRRHFDGIKGGRTRVSDTLLTKTVFDALRGAQPLFHALFWRQHTSWDTCGPRLQ